MRCVLILGFICGTADAVDPPAERAEQIRTWIEQLDHPRFRVRETATKQLREVGAEAAKPLIKVARSKNLEASARAMAILAELAESSDLKIEEAARSALKQLAEINAPIAHEATAILNRRRARYLVQLQQAGAKCREDEDGLHAVVLDDVENLETALKLLQEFPEVEQVSLSNKRFDSRLASYLVPLRNINSLNLFQSSIGDEGLKHLKELPNLNHLPIGQTKITDEGLRLLGQMKQLRYLGVRGNNVTNAGLAHLKDLADLRGLNLGETKVTDDGLKRLASLTSLQEVFLFGTAVSDAGLEHLYDLKRLSSLWLAQTKTTNNGRKRLLETMPNVRIGDWDE